LSAAAKPLGSTTWLACLAVAVAAGDGDPATVHRMGRETFVAAARQQLPRFGGKRICHRIVDSFFDGLADRAGAVEQRRGALERVGFLLDDWCAISQRLSEVETRMAGVLDALGLTALVTSIPGVSVLGAAVILAETGDLSRFATGRNVVKHAGLNPVENTSATSRGLTKVSRRGAVRPTGCGAGDHAARRGAVCPWPRRCCPAGRCTGSSVTWTRSASGCSGTAGAVACRTGRSWWPATAITSSTPHTPCRPR